MQLFPGATRTDILADVVFFQVLAAANTKRGGVSFNLPPATQADCLIHCIRVAKLGFTTEAGFRINNVNQPAEDIPFCKFTLSYNLRIYTS